jgi:hypothetical protein
MVSMPDATPLVDLQAENQRLIKLLDAHNIEWRIRPIPAAVTASAPEPTHSNLNTDEKVADGIQNREITHIAQAKRKTVCCFFQKTMFHEELWKKRVDDRFYLLSARICLLSSATICAPSQRCRFHLLC